MRRMAQTDDPHLRAAVRVCGWGLVTLGLGLGLLPAGLDERAGHPPAQLSLAIGSVLGVALVARGVGQLQGREVAVLMLDIDHFKIVNDTYGQATGDQAVNRAKREGRNRVRVSLMAACA